MISIDTNNRMKEIAENLHRDVKDLLQESANIVTGFVRNGFCTVRGAADRWKNFTHDISGAFTALFQPGSRDATLPDMLPDQEPIVTVMESEEPALPVGTRMRLSEMEDLTNSLHDRYWDAEDEPDREVRLAIDYRLDGETDRYWLPIHIGPCWGSMLGQMQDHVNDCLSRPSYVTNRFYDAPVGLDKLLHEKFGPQLKADLEKLSTRVLGFFQQHYTISQLEQQFGQQAMAIPEKERNKFLQGMRSNIRELREAANKGQVVEPAHERTEPAREDARPRQSVKVKLNRIKQEQAKSPVRIKARIAPER